jgi:sugar (pentulose or hexulose) kinase
VGELTRCILESLALAYRATLQELEEITGFAVSSIHIIGGGARSTLLNRFAASAMDRPVSAGPLEAAAVGNLCAQFLAAGEMEALSEARRAVRASFDIREFLPENASTWNDAFERFLLIKNVAI